MQAKNLGESFHSIGRCVAAHAKILHPIVVASRVEQMLQIFRIRFPRRDAVSGGDTIAERNNRGARIFLWGWLWGWLLFRISTLRRWRGLRSLREFPVGVYLAAASAQCRYKNRQKHQSG